MFTGIVERTGRVVSLTSPAATPGMGAVGTIMSSITQLLVDAGKGFETKPGDSVSVNGCCLTVTSNKVSMLAFDVTRETLAKTSLGELLEGGEVNLERAMKLGDRLGGHIVSGHVDGVASVAAIRKGADGWDVQIDVPRALARYIISKGSICLDGVSLTVNSVEDHDHATRIALMLIPTTVSLTAFKSLAEGHVVNVEVDMIGKYLERLGEAWRS